MKTHSAENIRRRKKQEVILERLFQEQKWIYEREHTIDYKCTTSPVESAVCDNKHFRIDFVRITERGIFAIEVDEDQHRHYEISCETARMCRVEESLRLGGTTQPLVFVRYNPDRVQYNGVTQRIPRAQRHAALLTLLETYIPREGMTIVYLFYDRGEDGTLQILKDDEYSSLARACVDGRNVDCVSPSGSGAGMGDSSK